MEELQHFLGGCNKLFVRWHRHLCGGVVLDGWDVGAGYEDVELQGRCDAMRGAVDKVDGEIASFYVQASSARTNESIRRSAVDN
jgi:hypothetical protein